MAAPANSSLDDFDWRVSMVRVGTDGPFSEFAGIDRTLAVIEGTGLELTIKDRAPITLGLASEPISFAGDVKTSARLLAGEITDLNVMTRRARFRDRLTCIREPAERGLTGDDVAVVLAVNGHVTVASNSEVVTLEHRDAAVLTQSNDMTLISPAADCECYLVLLRELGNQPG
jgi:environmental stress-induced protein Ves